VGVVLRICGSVTNAAFASMSGRLVLRTVLTSWTVRPLLFFSVLACIEHGSFDMSAQCRLFGITF